MTTLFFIVLANLFSRVAAVGLAGVLSFWFFSRYGNLVAAFAAGLLLTIASTHLIPEALTSGVDSHQAGIVLLASFVVFLLIESSLSRLGVHSHGSVRVRPVPALLGGGVRLEKSCGCGAADMARAPVLLAGAACHSFVDGVLVAAAFSIDFVSGVIVATAVTAHELPQVIGQIVILMQAGMERRRAALCVFLASLASVAGGVAGWALLSALQWLVGYAMLVSAASFIFVVLAVLMPELLHSSEPEGGKPTIGLTLSVLLGIVFSFLILQPLHEQTHRLAEAGSEYAHTHAYESGAVNQAEEQATTDHDH